MATFQEADKAYLAHHVNCSHCIASGLRVNGAPRCGTGKELWEIYLQACGANKPQRQQQYKPKPKRYG